MKGLRQITASKTLKLFFSLAFITCLFQSQAAFAQTLRPSSNGRYIEWSNGTPVFLLSDTAWMLGPRYTQTEVVNHANTRKSQGFAAIQLAAVMPSLHPLTDAFTSGDFSRPVASYWTALDAKVKAITDTGLVVIINPYWLKSDNTFTTEKALNANSDAKCLAYGRFFGTRYRNNRFVAYFLGGDARPNRGVDNTSRLNNLGLGIDQVYAEAGLPKPVMSYHSAPGVHSRESFGGASWLTLNWTYSYSEPLGPDGDANYFENWDAWAVSPAMPVMHAEGWYDRDNGATTTSRFGNRHMVRRQGWHCVLAGSLGGVAYGAEPIWLHGYNGISPATAATWNSGKDAVRMKTILSLQQWWRLRPDTTASFISGGVGAGMDRAIGATADDGSFGMAYTPVAHTFNLRMPGTGRTFTLTWHDPANGATRAIRTATSGTTVTVTTPGTNSSGQQDWVVVASSGGTPTNIAPTVSLTSPANGATFASGANLTLNATAADSDGTVTQVAFYRGSTLIGTDTSSPYSVTWSGATGGTYSLTAVATDDDGATTTSSAASITVSGSSIDPANGTYKIINVNSNKCLDQIGNGTAAGSNCEQWDYLGGADQKWIVTSLGNGEYSITCSASALRLQFDAATTPAAEIATASTATIQKWKFVTSANGYSITNVANGKVLDVKEFSVANGGVVQGWANTGTTNQKWTLQAP